MVNSKKARKVAEDVKNELEKFGKVEITGSLRRGKKRVNDIDILGNNTEMTNKFLTLGLRKVGKDFGKKASIYREGIQIDLWIVPDESWNTGLLQTTGDKWENIWLRGIAKRSGYCLNIYGLWYNGHNFVNNGSEKDVYRTLGVEYREPEKRRGWKK